MHFGGVRLGRWFKVAPSLGFIADDVRAPDKQLRKLCKQAVSLSFIYAVGRLSVSSIMGWLRSVGYDVSHSASVCFWAWLCLVSELLFGSRHVLISDACKWTREIARRFHRWVHSIHIYGLSALLLIPRNAITISHCRKQQHLSFVEHRVLWFAFLLTLKCTWAVYLQNADRVDCSISW